MIDSNIINSRQNEIQYLKIQYAARKYFNTAEIVNYLSWIFCILSALSVFFPSDTTKFITMGIPIILDTLAFITAYIFNCKLKIGANLRNYFDSQVLMINQDNYTPLNKQEFNELAAKIYQKNQSKADICIHNTGRDIPPGVYNWYEFKEEINDINAQYECQKQNIWWNKKMVKNRLVCLPVFFGILLIFFTLIFVFLQTDMWIVITCSAGIFLKIVERIIEHYKYHVISIKIETIQNHIETQLTPYNIAKLQDLINKRREITVLEINIIHRNKAKKYSTLYEEIS